MDAQDVVVVTEDRGETDSNLPIGLNEILEMNEIVESDQNKQAPRPNKDPPIDHKKSKTQKPSVAHSLHSNSFLKDNLSSKTINDLYGKVENGHGKLNEDVHQLRNPKSPYDKTQSEDAILEGNSNVLYNSSMAGDSKKPNNEKFEIGGENRGTTITQVNSNSDKQSGLLLSVGGKVNNEQASAEVDNHRPHNGPTNVSKVAVGKDENKQTQGNNQSNNPFPGTNSEPNGSRDKPSSKSEPTSPTVPNGNLPPISTSTPTQSDESQVFSPSEDNGQQTSHPSKQKNDDKKGTTNDGSGDRKDQTSKQKGDDGNQNDNPSTKQSPTSTTDNEQTPANRDNDVKTNGSKMPESKPDKKPSDPAGTSTPATPAPTLPEKNPNESIEGGGTKVPTTLPDTSGDHNSQINLPKTDGKNDLNAGSVAPVDSGVSEAGNSIFDSSVTPVTVSAIAAIVIISFIFLWLVKKRRNSVTSSRSLSRFRAKMRKGLRSLYPGRNSRRVELVCDYSGGSFNGKGKPLSPQYFQQINDDHYYPNTIPGQITLSPNKLVKIDDVYVEQPSSISFLQEDNQFDANAATIPSDIRSFTYPDTPSSDTPLSLDLMRNPTIEALKGPRGYGNNERVSSFTTNESVMFFEDSDLSHIPNHQNQNSSAVFSKKVVRPFAHKEEPSLPTDPYKKHMSTKSMNSLYSDIDNAPRK